MADVHGERNLMGAELLSGEQDRALMAILSEVAVAFPDVSVQSVDPATGKITFSDEPLVGFEQSQAATLRNFEERLRDAYANKANRVSQTEPDLDHKIVG